MTVLCPPSRVSAWAIPALLRLAEVCYGQSEYFLLSTLQDLRDEWCGPHSGHVVVFTDNPDRALADALLENRGPVIALLEDPIGVVKHLMASHALDPVSAARLTTTTFATLESIANSASRLLRITAAECVDPDNFLTEVCNFIDVNLSEEQRNWIVSYVGVYYEDDHYYSNIDLFIPTEVTDAVGPLRSILLGASVSEFIWSPSLFLGVDNLGDPSNLPVESSIDLLGPARILLYGPYFHLPKGKWDANVVFSVADNISGNRLFVELMSGMDLLVGKRATLPEQGRFQIILSFEVEEPRDPIQLRMSTLEGAIEGVLSLDGVFVRSSIGMPPSS